MRVISCPKINGLVMFFLSFPCLALLMIALVCSLGRPAHAGGNDSAESTTVETRDISEIADIPRIESYFNAITTMQARFSQAAPDGSIATGQFYLSRPGKLRFEYDDPIKDFIVADGKRLYFYDGEMEQVSQTDISNTLAYFILRPQLSLNNELQVTEIHYQGKTLWLSLVERDAPDRGKLILGFSENPLTLRKWRVVDGEGRITEVELHDIKTGLKLRNDLFRFSDPRRGIDWDYN